MLFKIFISDIQPAAGTAMNIEAAPSGKSPSTTTDSYLFYTHVSFCFALTTLLMQFCLVSLTVHFMDRSIGPHLLTFKFWCFQSLAMGV